jgi:L-ascorbate metabolism protein UlaG (beta-lactamase superfamily)
MHYGTFPILEPTADRFVAELSKVSPKTRPIVLSPGEETTL